MKRILLVEDNPAYADAANQCLALHNIEIVRAKDYNEAVSYIGKNGLDGAIIDCFFPEITGSDKKSLGYHAVQKMLSLDNTSRRNTPVAKAIAKVGNIVGITAVKHFVKNAKINYRDSVDFYWALEQAIREDEAKQPLGILLAEEAQSKGLPFVLATSTYHHDELTQPIQNYAGKQGWTLVDCAEGKENDKASPEFWSKVFSELEIKLKN